MVKESKITYVEGSEIRVIRGVLEKEDSDFIVLKRRDGIHRINKKFVTTIEEECDF